MTIKIDFKQNGHLRGHKTYYSIHPGTIEIVNGTLYFAHADFRDVAKYRIDLDEIDRLTMKEDES